MGPRRSLIDMGTESPVAEPRYDTAAFAMPEGVEFDSEGFAAAEPVLRDLNLTQDQAGKLVGVYAGKIAPMVQKRARASVDNDGAELRAAMERELEADPVVGGKNLNQARAFAARAIAAGIPDAQEREAFVKFLNVTGFGNQRHLLRVLAGAGRLLSGGKPVSEAEKFYGRTT